jgi:hypothetical protein
VGIAMSSSPRPTAALLASALLLLSGACAPGSGSSEPAVVVTTPYPILFVTQVPVVSDFLTVASTFGNHDPSPRAVPRGGDLWIRYENGDLRNLTREAGFGNPDGFQGSGSIAVRQPCVHWNGQKAVFSMVLGAPTTPGDGNTHWQLYEVTGLGRDETAVVTRVPNQPGTYDNVSPCYTSDGRILFTSNRPRNGAAHLHPQLDEYEEAPTNTGIWSLNPGSGELFLMNHSASGSFEPIVDSYGRVVFTRWDHLERDQQADIDRIGGNYQVFNYSSEAPDSFNTGSDLEVFPEPRKAWIDFVNSTPGYMGDLAGWEPHLVGNSFNHFQLWTLNQDGTREETLNHIGRHELFYYFNRSRNDDFGVVDHPGPPPACANREPIDSFHQPRQAPFGVGLYYGVDCREFDTHSAGQIIRITGDPGLNANQMAVTSITHPDTRAPTPTPGPNHSGLYRNPLPLSDGWVIVSHTANTRKDADIGSPGAPRSRFDFRLKRLEVAGNGYLKAGAPLTPGLARHVEYWDPYNYQSHTGNLWELDAVEVVARPAPPLLLEPDPPPREQLALQAAGVGLTELRTFLRDNDLALIVSRNVTSRDANDLQQPARLRVPGTSTQTLSPSGGTIYDVAYLRIFQGDLIRGITNGIFGTFGGRRALAQPLHEPAADNAPSTGPSGSVEIGTDGSMAALVPARRALSWQLTDEAGNPVVNERYWISFQPGEIRTCTTCHGLNEENQAGLTEPTNTPEALVTLLDHLQAQGHL